ncbi:MULTISPECIES: hypothetical protein [Spirulina sp. CCY15215]|uniref:hypothetical protein n=1 Tax=Spirulina sp. CCY15215 TaxID=2767591 RepID=UPI00194F5AED|nr:hypothetical protein [Spirulina major]
MLTINDISLKDAKPTDRPHLLLWDNPNDSEIKQLIFNNNAQLVSYRDNLLSRINLKHKFLSLQEKLGEELDAIRQTCENADKPIILLQDIDILVSYLYSKPKSPISLFWQKLANMRHLERILWIILPTKLMPQNWNHRSLIHIKSESQNI